MKVLVFGENHAPMAPTGWTLWCWRLDAPRSGSKCDAVQLDVYSFVLRITLSTLLRVRIAGLSSGAAH